MRALSAAILTLLLPLSGPGIHSAWATETAIANLHAGESVGHLQSQGQPFTIYTSAANRGPGTAQNVEVVTHVPRSWVMT